MSRILTWDLEIRHPVASVGGWHAVRSGEAGVSVLAIKDSETGRMHFYDDTCLEEAVTHLNEADLLVGFNTLSFDTAVVESLSAGMIAAPQYDILAAIWAALPRRPKGYKLDEVAARTIGAGKSGNGEFSTALVADGLWAKLFDYCTNDVHITAKLFNHIAEHGWVIDPDGNQLWLEPPPLKEPA